MKRHPRAHLPFLIIVFGALALISCTRRGNSGLASNTPGLDPFDPFRPVTTFDNSFSCSVKSIQFKAWARYAPDPTQPPAPYPVFYFEVKASASGAAISKVSSTPTGLAYGYKFDPRYVALLQSNQIYSVNFEVVIPSTGKGTRCQAAVNYAELMRNVPPAPWWMLGSLPVFDPFLPVTVFPPIGSGGDLTKPSRFNIEGPTRIYTIDCNAYEIQTINSQGTVVATPREVDVALMDTGTGLTEVGAFFSDSSCRQPIFNLTFNVGESRKKVYYLSGTARNTVLIARSEKEGSTSIYADGELPIEILNNPRISNDLGINFEDWTDWDYNDSVVCIRNSRLVVDGTTITSYANQTVSFQISGVSACDQQVKLQVYDNAGNMTGNIFVPSTKPNPTVTLDFTVGSRLEISFYAMGACNMGTWINQHHNRVRVLNACRGQEVEGQPIGH